MNNSARSHNEPCRVQNTNTHAHVLKMSTNIRFVIWVNCSDGPHISSYSHDHPNQHMQSNNRDYRHSTFNIWDHWLGTKQTEMEQTADGRK